MKTAIACAIFLLLISSCRSLSYFESPNNLRNVAGTLYLQNGQTHQGRLIVQTDNFFGSPVKLYTDEDKRPMQFSLDAVKGFTVQGHAYELKEIRETISLGRQVVFMRRLTPEASRMHLYEYKKRETVNKTRSRYVSEFSVQLPNETEDAVYAASSAKFVPHFEVKMSRMLHDCPLLAKKIAEKKHGYFYAQVNIVREHKSEVLLKIIDEYNQCQQQNAP